MYKEVIGAQLLARSSELESYFTWAVENGIVLNKVVYPCRFPLGYFGIQAIQDIGAYETIISVPNSLLITTKVAEDSELGDLFREYDDFFDEDDVHYEDLVLTTYLIWEKYKGDRSKWYHFIRNQPTSFDTLQDWSIEELQELQDPEVVFDAKQQVSGVLKRYSDWKKVLLKSKVFSSDMTDYKNFIWVYRLLGTRSFGKFCPHTTFAPIAEFFNHHNTLSYYYYGTFAASVESAKRYTNFYLGQDHDDDLILKKQVSEIAWKKIIKFVLQEEVSRDSDKFRLVKEAEALDLEEKSRRDLDYGKPDPELLRESNEKSLSIISGNEVYERGSEVYMSYGRYSNRMLLSTYGFALENNIYDFARLILSIDQLCEDRGSLYKSLDSGRTYFFKVKSDQICKDLIRLVRVANWTDQYPINACFSPASRDLELKALGIVLRILNDRLGSFPTTYEQDIQALSSISPLRRHFAILYRSSIKKILIQQIELIHLAISILSTSGPVESVSEEILQNLDPVQASWARSALKPYTQCYAIYQS